MTIRPTAFPSPFARPDAASRPETARPEAAQPAAKAAETGAAPGAGALSSAERQALAREFPETPTLALRLYGPQRGAAEPAPALGSRLDLRG